MINYISGWHESYLDATEGCYTHVEEDAVEYRHRDELGRGRTESHVILAVSSAF